MRHREGVSDDHAQRKNLREECRMIWRKSIFGFAKDFRAQSFPFFLRKGWDTNEILVYTISENALSLACFGRIR